jgi:hypothetical protein
MTSFLDTTQQDFPNYYNYRRRAREIGAPADSLLQCLHTFYKTGTNQFIREENYYLFKVVVGFTINRDYLYFASDNLSPGGSLIATAARNRDYHYSVVIEKRVGKGGFECYENPGH